MSQKMIVFALIAITTTTQYSCHLDSTHSSSSMATAAEESFDLR